MNKGKQSNKMMLTTWVVPPWCMHVFFTWQGGAGRFCLTHVGLSSLQATMKQLSMIRDEEEMAWRNHLILLLTFIIVAWSVCFTSLCLVWMQRLTVNDHIYKWQQYLQGLWERKMLPHKENCGNCYQNDGPSEKGSKCLVVFDMTLQGCQ